MGEWESLLFEILKNEKNKYVEYSLYIKEENEILSMPRIVQATLLLLDKQFEKQDSKTYIVFPENMFLSYFFVLTKTIDEINNKRFNQVYDLSEFKIGDKVKILNYVVIYNGIEIRNKMEYLKIKFSDSDYLCPIKIAPILQKIDTNRALSKQKNFQNDVSENNRVNSFSKELSLCQKLENSITHIKSSIIYVTHINKTKGFLVDTYINDKPILDIMLVGQINPSNEINIINPNQITGVPPILLASDLFQAVDALSLVNDVKAIYIDIKSYSSFSNQIHLLDELKRKRIPLIIFSDFENLVSNNDLMKRDFKVWKWTSNNISQILINKNNRIDKKLVDFRNKKFSKLVFINEKITFAFSNLRELRLKQDELNANTNEIIEVLYTILIRCVRAIYPISKNAEAEYLDQLENCNKSLNKEKRFLDDTVSKEILDIIDSLKEIINSNCKLEKINYVKDVILKNEYNQITIVIDNRDNKRIISNYLNYICFENSLKTIINVEYVYEFIKNINQKSEISFICSWFNQRIMNSIYFNFTSSNTIVLLYDYERKWADYHHNLLKSRVEHSNNSELLNQNSMELNYIHRTDNDISSKALIDNIEEIELKINTYRKSEYIKIAHQGTGNDLVDVYPIEFDNNYIMFSKSTHEFIIATKILIGESDEIDLKKSEDLEIGDFVVIRESERSIIKELADNILKESKLIESRQLSSIWKESLRILALTKSYIEIKKEFDKVGCNRSLITIKEWITNDERIMPSSKDDLVSIAKVTEDIILSELVDKVYIAGKNVRNAHMKAGTILSKQLKHEIVKLLESNYEIDPYSNDFEYNLTIEGIGKAKLIKIQDIGLLMKVDSSLVNKLISKNK